MNAKAVDTHFWVNIDNMDYWQMHAAQDLHKTNNIFKRWKSQEVKWLWEHTVTEGQKVY